MSSSSSATPTSTTSCRRRSHARADSARRHIQQLEGILAEKERQERDKREGQKHDPLEATTAPAGAGPNATGDKATVKLPFDRRKVLQELHRLHATPLEIS